MQYFTARNFARSILARAQKKKKLHLSVTELETSPGGKKVVLESRQRQQIIDLIFRPRNRLEREKKKKDERE